MMQPLVVLDTPLICGVVAVGFFQQWTSLVEPNESVSRIRNQDQSKQWLHLDGHQYCVHELLPNAIAHWVYC
jgi:hypothetical protein